MNCIIVDDDELIRIDLEEKIRQTMTLNLVGSCGNALEASNIVMTKSVDLIFLDVMMPEMTGLEFIKTLSASRPEVILITSNKEFAAEAFEYDVTDFLLKPISFERFIKAVSKAKRNFDKKGTTINKVDDHIFIKVSSRFVKLDLKNILYIEALADYVTIYTPTDKYTIHSTMKGMENTLPANEFARVHNSFIVRLDKISVIEDNSIIINKTTIPVSRNKFKPLMQRLKLM
ncbi:MAG: two component transcriptional regulator, LytTR family [Bacteroidetes bacterium]|jgi:DNA-binding LytR/AlgR family response regulator|nr:two component transcriptional regulator, LytTR family [Bacteroidota bacterium]